MENSKTLEKSKKNQKTSLRAKEATPIVFGLLRTKSRKSKIKANVVHQDL